MTILFWPIAYGRRTLAATPRHIRVMLVPLASVVRQWATANGNDRWEGRRADERIRSSVDVSKRSQPSTDATWGPG